MTIENKEETTMERKIGEIFEYNDKWYQCVKGDICADCAFVKKHCNDSSLFEAIGSCNKFCRKDAASVIFKELEKVGKPITVNGKNVQLLKTTIANCKNCAFYLDDNCDFTCDPRNCYGGEEGTYVELKQTKEDMEEQGQCGDNRFEIIAKAKEALLEETNIARDKQEMAVIDNILFRCWQMGWLDKYDDTKHSNSESIGKNLKPFDLEAAKVGKPVCTRDGRKARIICFDAKGYRPIVALIEVDCEDDCTPEDVFLFTDKGYYNCSSIASDYDLMMLPVKKEGWVNVYKHFAYRTKEEAQSNINPDNELIDTIKIEWEEYS